MARNNCTVDPGEGLFYINQKYLNIYHRKDDPTITLPENEIQTEKADEYEYDQQLSQNRFDEIKNQFLTAYQKRYKSMKSIDTWNTKKKRHIMLENDMFYVAFEDNDWSIAVELLYKQKVKSPEYQARIAPSFKRSMRNILLTILPEIELRTGSWTSKTITKQIARQIDKEEKLNKKLAKEQTKTEKLDMADPDSVD